MTNPYENLRTRINTLLPDRLKLEFGETMPCNFKNCSDDLRVFGMSCVLCKGKDVVERYPVSLQDILRAIETKHKGIVTGTDGRFWRLIEKDDKLQFIAYKLQLDLSLPPKEWSEEILLEIIKLLE